MFELSVEGAAIRSRGATGEIFYMLKEVLRLREAKRPVIKERELLLYILSSSFIIILYSFFLIVYSI